MNWRSATSSVRVDDIGRLHIPLKEENHEQASDSSLSREDCRQDREQNQSTSIDEKTESRVKVLEVQNSNETSDSKDGLTSGIHV